LRTFRRFSRAKRGSCRGGVFAAQSPRRKSSATTGKSTKGAARPGAAKRPVPAPAGSRPRLRTMLRLYLFEKRIPFHGTSLIRDFSKKYTFVIKQTTETKPNLKLKKVKNGNNNKI